MSATRTTLHLTNGTSVIPLMREAGITGSIVPWEDVLHEGPVPSGLNPVALRERRAEFLASCGWGAADAIARDLAARDAALDGASIAGRPATDEIVLWFEHDLYDQLQLIQILDRLPADGAPLLTAVPGDEYLGLLPATRFVGLFAARREVTSAERLAARDAWNAFRSPDPRAIVDVLPRVSVLRHLGSALTRHLEQFPSMDNGLSRTEQQAMEAIAAGITRLADVFVRSHQGREPAMFMGDAVFLVHLSPLLRKPRPLLRASRPTAELSLDDQVSLTDDGHRVLAADLDRVQACGIDRWLGGVHVSGTGPVWRWDQTRRAMRLV